MADKIALTTRDDVVTAQGSAGVTVFAGTSTLNPNDKLTGGSGTDVLKLYNDNFDLASLKTFTGFEQVALTNANVKLGAQSLAVVSNGSEQSSIELGSGTVAITVESGGSYIQSSSATIWRLRNTIDGRNGFTSIQLNTDFNSNVTYNLSGNTFKSVGSLGVIGDQVTLKASTNTFKGVSRVSFYHSAGQITTGSVSLDLSQTKVSKASIQSTRAAGTNFIVGDANTALGVVGGTGQDTVTGKGFAFTSEQREAIFTLGSIEKIVDTSGTYAAPPAGAARVNTAAMPMDADLTHALFDAAFRSAPPINAPISSTADQGMTGLLAAHS